MEKKCQVCGERPAVVRFVVTKLSPDPVYVCDKKDLVGSVQDIPGVTWCCLARWMNDKLGTTPAQWRDPAMRASIPFLQPIEKEYLTDIDEHASFFKNL
jgi:hypothetical protein